MPLNILYGEVALLLGETLFQEWEREFNKAWYGPMSELLIKMLLAQLPHEVIDQLRTMNPEAMKNVEKHYGGA